ncbi:MAG TPA: hypothetical protein DCZ56_05230 [Sutterella sp.]|nr:hypothetical protein [Sutterella sp.]
MLCRIVRESLSRPWPMGSEQNTLWAALVAKMSGIFPVTGFARGFRMRVTQPLKPTKQRIKWFKAVMYFPLVNCA